MVSRNKDTGLIMIGSNGAPQRSDADTIRRLGELCFGDRWIAPAAICMCTHPRQIRRWLDGEGWPTERQLVMLRKEARWRMSAIAAALEGDVQPGRQRAELVNSERQGAGR